MARTRSLSLALALALAWGAGGAAAADEPWRFTGSVRLIDVTTRAQPGDLGYLHDGNDTAETSLAALRLQLEGQPLDWLGYELHYVNLKRAGTPAHLGGEAAGAQRYRFQSLRWELERPEPRPGDPAAPQTLVWYHELDRAALRVRGGAWQATLGRQPITWGAGRFWQPTDLFAAFAPTELEREYKPGIDALLLEAFPARFAALALAYVASPRGGELDDSAVARWRTAVGAVSEATAVAGTVQEEALAGGSFESVWGEAGWRVEGIAFRPRDDAAGTATFAIAGVDHQFANGLLLLAELYHHSLGAARAEELPQVAARTAFREGRMPHLSRTVAALLLEHELTGLLRGSYALFAAPLRTEGGATRTSTLHQGTLTYSIGNNAEAMFSLLLGRGQGLDAFGRPRSEFGHLPDTLFAKLQFYF